MTVTSRPELTSDQLQALDGYWRAANRSEERRVGKECLE